MNYRSRDFLDLAYNFGCMLQLPCCEGGNAGEPAHSNQSKHGKGGGMKAHDHFTVPACRACHRELDQGKTLTLEQRREIWDAAYWRYITLLFLHDYIRVAPRRKVSA